MQACRDLNEVAHDLLPECKLISNDLVKLTAVSLFLRVISSFSAAVKLFEAGIYQDAGTVLRSEVESAIFLKAVAINGRTAMSQVYGNSIIATSNVSGTDPKILGTPPPKP